MRATSPDVREKFTRYVDMALAGETIEITRHGDVKAVLVGPARFKHLTDLEDAMKQAGESPAEGNK